MKNPLYGDALQWETLLIQEQLEYIRKHICTGPCLQSMQVMTQQERINSALKHAIHYINQSVEAIK